MCRMAKEGGGARDTRIAMSIVEIHNDAIQDLLSNDPFRRLDIKTVGLNFPQQKRETSSALINICTRDE